MLSARDIIKWDVLEFFAGASGFTLSEIFMILLLACVIGAYIFFVYKNFSKAAFYSKDLNITLACLSVIVAAVMIAMQSNLLVSLGMIGALSIVRFRTAVKSPMDLLYLFWSISAGIICGVNLYLLAAVLCLIMTALLFILERVPGVKASALLIVRVSMSVPVESIAEIVKQHSSRLKESAVAVKNKEREIIFEVESKEKEKLLAALESNGEVISVNWLEHSGEMRA